MTYSPAQMSPADITAPPRRTAMMYARRGGSALNDQQQEGQEQQDMHSALKEMSASARECNDAHGERQRQQDEVGVFGGQYDVVTAQPADDEHGRHGQSNRGQYRAETDVDR